MERLRAALRERLWYRVAHPDGAAVRAAPGLAAAPTGAVHEAGSAVLACERVVKDNEWFVQLAGRRGWLREAVLERIPEPDAAEGAGVLWLRVRAEAGAAICGAAARDTATDRRLPHGLVFPSRRRRAVRGVGCVQLENEVGWVFEAAEDGERVLERVDEPSVQEGLFFFRVAHPKGIGLRVGPDLAAARTGEYLPAGELVRATMLLRLQGRDTTFVRVQGRRGWGFDALDADTPVLVQLEPAEAGVEVDEFEAALLAPLEEPEEDAAADDDDQGDEAGPFFYVATDAVPLLAAPSANTAPVGELPAGALLEAARRRGGAFAQLSGDQEHWVALDRRRLEPAEGAVQPEPHHVRVLAREGAPVRAVASPAAAPLRTLPCGTIAEAAARARINGVGFARLAGGGVLFDIEDNRRVAERCEAPDVQRGRFTYRVRHPKGAGLRAGPDVEAPRTGEFLECGFVFEADTRLRRAGSAVVFVRLASGQGWTFEATPEAGQVLASEVGDDGGGGGGGGEDGEDEDDGRVVGRFAFRTPATNGVLVRPRPDPADTPIGEIPPDTQFDVGVKLTPRASELTFLQLADKSGWVFVQRRGFRTPTEVATDVNSFDLWSAVNEKADAALASAERCRTQ